MFHSLASVQPLAGRVVIDEFVCKQHNVEVSVNAAGAVRVFALVCDTPRAHVTSEFKITETLRKRFTQSYNNVIF